jgi:PKD repeat protein
MPALRPSGLAAVLLLAPAALALAEGPTIEHSAIKCIVAGKYRKMPARFAPPEVAQPRVYFRPEGVPSWYYVEMKPEAALGHVGVLPKPTKKLVGQHIEYYLEAASRDFDTGRTPEYDPIVVARDSDCSNDPVAAFYSKEPPSAVFPSVPEGFAIGGGLAGGTTAAIVGGGVAAGGAAVLIAKGGDEEPIPTPTTQPPVTSPPVTQPPVTQPPGSPADVACQADPRQGRAPLQVKFNAQASGGNGVFDYAWTFGDGDSSTQVNPSHTYTTPGVYEARVVATSVDRSAACTRTITVLANTVELRVDLAGGGTGSVAGPGIGCPGDCGEEYEPGTSVTLTAAPSGGSTFAGWSGDCSGAGACQVTMDGDRAVTATFNPPPTLFPLNVTIGGTGTGTVSGSGIACPGTCSQTYTAGTAVSLTAAPGGTSAFGGWGGDCTGVTGLTCNLTMNGPRNVSATFSVPTTFRLTLSVDQNAAVVAGVEVVPSTVIMFCDSNNPPNVCVEDYTPGTTVTLRPVDETGDHLAWGGDCAAVAPGSSCVLAMTQNRTVTALFGFGVTAPGTSTLVSRLEAPSGRAEATLNGSSLGAITEGMRSLTLSVPSGENRLEGALVAGARGTWTLDLSGIAELERGSLRVLTGDALAVGPDTVVFRLSGRANERVGVAFTKR